MSHSGTFDNRCTSHYMNNPLSALREGPFHSTEKSRIAGFERDKHKKKYEDDAVVPGTRRSVL